MAGNLPKKPLILQNTPNKQEIQNSMWALTSARSELITIVGPSHVHPPCWTDTRKYAKWSDDPKKNCHYL